MVYFVEIKAICSEHGNYAVYSAAKNSIRSKPDELIQLGITDCTGEQVLEYFDQSLSDDDLADLEDLYLAEQRSDDIRQGKRQTIPLEEVMKEYDMVEENNDNPWSGKSSLTL